MESIEDQLGRILNNYSDEVVDALDQEARKMGNEARRIIRKNAPKRTGTYAGSWQLKRQGRLKGSTYVVHSPKHYRRAHLLEKGHAVVVNGQHKGRARAFPHIAPAEKFVVENYPKRVTNRIRGLS